VSRHVCPHCGVLVRAVYDGAAVLPDSDLARLYAEHDPCPGSYQPIDTPQPQAPQVLARPDADEPPQWLRRNTKPGDRAREILAALMRIGPSRPVEIARAAESGHGAIRQALARMAVAGTVVRHEGTYAPSCPLRGVGPQVWALVACVGGLTTAEIAEGSGKSVHGARSALGILRRGGLAEQRDGLWSLASGWLAAYTEARNKAER